MGRYREKTKTNGQHGKNREEMGKIGKKRDKIGSVQKVLKIIKKNYLKSIPKVSQ